MRRFIAIFTAAALLAAMSTAFTGCSGEQGASDVSGVQSGVESSDTSINSDSGNSGGSGKHIGEIRDISSVELVKELKLGWNIGNTLDGGSASDKGKTPTEIETAWGNPVITKELIDMVKNEGFNVLRVPVTWDWSTGEGPDYTISEAWMDRVEEVVNYGLDNDMYVILNIHHETWHDPYEDKYEEISDRLKKVWTQIGTRFKDYDEHLIFEGMNEPRLIRDPHEWHLDMKDETCRKAAEHINTFNQVFVDIVRASGGNNASRLLMVPSYAAGPAHAFMPEFRLPGDPADRLIVSIHVYDPQGLALLPDPDNTEFNEHGKKVLDFIFGSAYEKFVSKDVPVVIGEMGIVDKQNPDDRCRWCKYFVRNALEKEILSVWWDNGGRDFKLLDRRNLSVYKDAEPVLTGLLEGLKG